jgi:hypothetical protein
MGVDNARREISMTPQSQERIEKLEREVKAIRLELAGARKRAAGGPGASEMVTRAGWIGAPLILAAWALLSGSSSSIARPGGYPGAEVLKRLADLELRVGSTSGSPTKILAPFEVLDHTGKTILRVSDDPAGDQEGRIVIAPSTHENYGLVFRTASGETAAILSETEDGDGRLQLLGTDRNSEVRIGGGSTETGGGMTIVNKGQRVVMLGRNHVSGGGILRLTNAGGKVLAGISGSPGGDGLVEVFHGGTQVAVLTVGAAGAGMLQLSSPSGTPTVEAGTIASGLGVVRTGPRFKCTGDAGLRAPDCIMGRP